VDDNDIPSLQQLWLVGEAVESWTNL